MSGPNDKDPFLEEMASVVPLSERDKHLPRSPKSVPRPPVDDDALVVEELAALVEGQGDFDMRWSEEHLEGLAQGVDRRVLRKLRKGHFSHRRHLDLHGYTRAEAKPLVSEFIRQSRKDGERCVLIVHGRGHNSKDNMPVLKDALRGWLVGRAIGRSVLAFCSAGRGDGGLGAVYILLRK